MNHKSFNVDFYGLKITIFDADSIKNTIINSIERDRKKVFYGYSMWTITAFRKMPELYRYSESFDVMVTDGMWFYWFAKLFKVPLKYNLSIPLLTNLILNIANSKGYSLMLIGSTGETNKLATEFLRKKYQNINVFDGHHGGTFNEDEQQETVKRINSLSPDILLIGVSSPIKEAFAYNWVKKLDVGIIVPFGGMIDGLAGKVKLVPPFYKKIGLGTWYRVFQEPTRLLKNRIYTTKEVFFRILPITIFQVILLQRKDFKIPAIYGASRKNKI